MPTLRLKYNSIGEPFLCSKGSVSIGRTQGDLLLDDPEVSGIHARLVHDGGDWYIEDLNSKNGVYVNDELIDGTVQLHPGDKILVGSTCLVFEDDSKDSDQHSARSLDLSELRDGRPRLIGRDPDADIRIDEALVSRRHASITGDQGRISVADLNSTNGTFVNGQAVSRKELSPGDILRVGATEFVLRDGLLDVDAVKGAIRLDVQSISHLVSHRGQMRTLLDGVEFTVKPGELVGIVGASGAGKTSLFRVLTGLESPSLGNVMLNGVDYHSHRRQFAGQIGFVPQDDIVHSELTVRSALTFAAKLRLPADTTQKECAERVVSVLDAVDLLHRTDSDIKLLSGGERKRVNVALELITEPNIMLLDEPTSGLDPHREHQIMELMRSLAGQGRTILLTTHSTLSLDLCDLLLVMGCGGRVVFYGPPREALRHFRCSEYQDIYARIGETLEESARCQHDYWSSPVFREYGETRGMQRADASPVPVAAGSSRLDLSGWLRQFSRLSQRYLSILIRDRGNLGILLAQAPLLVLIILLVFPQNSFKPVVSSDGASPLRYASPITFLLAIIAIWFGVSNSVREIVKEASITTRERLSFLRMSAYLGSKFAVLAGLCTVQCLVLVLGVGVRMDWFGADQGVVWLLGGVLLLTSLAGLGLGLTISALARSSDQAISLTPMVLVPQIVFSGLFLPDNAGQVVDLMAKLHISHWAYGALGNVIDINGKIADLPLNIIKQNECFSGDLASKLVPLSWLFVLTIALALVAVQFRRSR